MINSERSCRSAGRQASLLPLLETVIKLLRPFHGRRAEANASFLRSSNTLLLSLADELTFGLRHIGQKLQHNVRNERAREIAARARIQQRHI